MRGPNAALTLRGLLPALAVTGVLALAALAPSSALGSADALGYGYGYGNNCGVKGSGFHDHGKACPNRPFPGKGKGLTKAVTEGNTSNASGGTTTSPGNSGSSADVDEDANGTTAPEVSTTTQATGSTHGHGRAHRGRP